MISLDQILVLEKKVESAVNKITQLQAENDALRSKCAELTNALSSKSEQLSSFEQDQGLIESKIVNLINRFNNIENSVLDVIGSSGSMQSPVTAIQQPVQTPAPEQSVQQTQVPDQNPIAQSQTYVPASEPVVSTPVETESEEMQQSFFDMNEVSSTDDNQSQESGQFDIF
ncbi:MAG: cell division protein ZapB [Spirochaetia bacterium]|nr:cell division protein ZapB [Spirochaetia bacterium]